MALEGRTCGRSSSGNTIHTCHQGGRVTVVRCVSEDRVAEDEVGIDLVRSCIPLDVSLKWKTGTVETAGTEQRRRVLAVGRSHKS